MGLHHPGFCACLRWRPQPLDDASRDQVERRLLKERWMGPLRDVGPKATGNGGRRVAENGETSLGRPVPTYATHASEPVCGRGHHPFDDVSTSTGGCSRNEAPEYSRIERTEAAHGTTVREPPKKRSAEAVRYRGAPGRSRPNLRPGVLASLVGCRAHRLSTTPRATGSSGGCSRKGGWAAQVTDGAEAAK